MIAKIKTFLLCIGMLAAANALAADVMLSFGLNFVSNENQYIPENTAAGFGKEAYDLPTAWFNLNNSNGKWDIDIGDDTFEVKCSARGTYGSDCGTDTLDGKLLATYLDDVVYDGREKAAIKISGLPADKKYAIALILSGDATANDQQFNNGDFNAKYSPVWINGVVYSYGVNEGTAFLLSGEDAVDVTKWGDRRKSASVGPSPLSEGKNVMFVEGLTGSTLIVTSALDAQNVSRLTIAGLQVWITDEDSEAVAVTSPADSEVISVNFHSTNGTVLESEEAGLVPARNWHNTTGAQGSLSLLTVANGVYNTTITYASSENWGYPFEGSGDNYLKGYLDDGEHDGVSGATISAANLPFENYSVVIYCATDESGQFKPVLVNGKLYSGSANLTSCGYAVAQPGLMQNTRICNWGTTKQKTSQYGVNAIRVDGLTGDLTIQGGSKQTFDGIKNRGGIAAVQIVNTGSSIFANVQKIDWTERPAELLKVSELPELTKEYLNLTLADGATLVIDQAVEGVVINVISAGNVTIKVTDLTIPAASIAAMLNTAGVNGTVENAYVETMGYTVDGVTYDLIFRGTTDGDWANLSNWYIGSRTNGEETYWIPYDGTKVPGATDSNEWRPTLIDGSLFAEGFSVDENGYKVVYLSGVSYEGWNSRIKVANGVHLKIAEIRKLQSANADNNSGWIKVDATSKMTITSLGTQGFNAFGGRFEILGVLTVENDFSARDNNPGYLYTLGVSGIVQYKGLSSTRTHKIQSVILNVGDGTLSGRCIASRKLIGFTSADAQTFTYEASGVVISRDGISANETSVLSEVGDYKFEMKEDGYYVSYMAYAEDDEIGETVWTNANGDGLWDTAANWSRGVPAEGAAAVVEVSGEVTLSIPENGVSVGILTVKGNGKVTLAGGKITAEGIAVKANLSASDATLELALMDIAEGVMVEYAADSDKLLPVLTGEGVFSKSGSGTFTVNANLACEPQLIWNTGTLLFGEARYQKAYNVIAKKGAKVKVGTWTGSLTSEGNVFTFEGGSIFLLDNGNNTTPGNAGSNIKGSIVIDSSIEDPVVFQGSNWGNSSDIQASIKGNGVVEILQENNYFTISGVISDGDGEGDKLSILYEADNIEVFSGQNTFTGGFNLRSGKTAKITNAKALGTGIATIDGTLQVGGSGLGSKVTGSGVIAATANETVQFVDGNAIIPSYENVLTINGKVGGTPIFDISTMDLANGKRFNLLKVNAVENLPEPFTDANFVNGESNAIPAGWVVALTPDGLGYCLKREAFVIRIR